MTIHNAKGLEFPVVFLTGMEDGVFPHVRSIGDPEQLEEERRLCYVGLTRAQQRVYVVHAHHRSLWGAPGVAQAGRVVHEVRIRVLRAGLGRGGGRVVHEVRVSAYFVRGGVSAGVASCRKPSVLWPSASGHHPVASEALGTFASLGRRRPSRRGEWVIVTRTARAAVAIVMVSAATGCDLVDRFAGSRGETVAVGGGTVTVNGTPNEPTTAKVDALRIGSPIGVVTVQTYDSQIGPCYDVVFDDGRREANCLHGSGIDPTMPVTGRPDASIEGVNASAWNAGLTEPGIGMFHHGLAHPTVRTVAVEPENGGPVTAFPVARARNVAGLAVFVAWSPEHVDRYRLAGYDAEGCFIDGEIVSVRGGGPGGPGGAGRDCSQTLPDADHVEELPAR